jgi:hypothetical protein
MDFVVDKFVFLRDQILTHNRAYILNNFLTYIILQYEVYDNGITLNVNYLQI